MSVTYADEVFEELVEMSAYLAELDEPLAQRFLDACDETFQLLASNPMLGSPNKFSNPRLAKLRMWRVKRFTKYLIFYEPTESGVKIYHVVHSATDYTRSFDE